MIAVPAESRHAVPAMPQARLTALQALWAPSAFLVLGCGPNVQMIYESNVRFEHCYRLDMDPTIAPAHRRACWQDWLARHTYAQSGDRLSYARQRLKDIDHGQLSTLTLQIDAGTATAPTADAVPLPSSVHAAPPPRAQEASAVPSQAPPVPAKKAEAPPEASCAESCVSHWNECAPSCEQSDDSVSAKNDGATKVPMGVTVPPSQKTAKDACGECRRSFKTCMRRCYK